jgi:glycosyltransferase involved in cell wall biosynthesis
MRRAIVIPAFNEQGTLREVVARARAVEDWIVVVDDGSTPPTAAQLEGLDVTVIRNERNFGKSQALRRGIEYVAAMGAQAVITLDADGQHPPEQIPELVAAARTHHRHIIMAARVRNRSKVPALRAFANRAADFWISWAAGVKILDTQSGFRFYPIELFDEVALNHSAGHGFVFESEILIEAARAGYHILPVPIDAIYIQAGRPSHYRGLTDTAKIVRMVAWKLLSKGLYVNGLLRSLQDHRTSEPK